MKKNFKLLALITSLVYFRQGAFFGEIGKKKDAIDAYKKAVCKVEF